MANLASSLLWAETAVLENCAQSTLLHKKTSQQLRKLPVTRYLESLVQMSVMSVLSVLYFLSFLSMTNEYHVRVFSVYIAEFLSHWALVLIAPVVLERSMGQD